MQFHLRSFKRLENCLEDVFGSQENDKMFSSVFWYGQMGLEVGNLDVENIQEMVPVYHLISTGTPFNCLNEMSEFYFI